jgi:hypothetical protein
MDAAEKRSDVGAVGYFQTTHWTEVLAAGVDETE